MVDGTRGTTMDTLTTVQWMHTLEHVPTAMAQAGLRVTHVLELPEEASGPGVRVLHCGPAELIVRATKDAR